jgi:hypothetical protein
MALLGELIWNNAIGRVAAEALGYSGSGLSSHLSAVVRHLYPDLTTAQVSTLTRLAFNADATARSYNMAAGNWAPSLSDLSDPRRLIRSAASALNVNLTGASTEFRYQYTYETLTQNVDTGAQVLRQNTLIIRSSSILTRDELDLLTEQRLAERGMQDAGTDPRLIRTIVGHSLGSVQIGYKF